MARKRMIDPGIWQSEQFGSMLTRDERLLFIGMFSNADDAGRLKASAKYLKATIFPYDEDITSADVTRWRNNIARALDGEGVAPICLYSVNGIEYLHLPKWKRWQKIDKPSPSALPEPPEHSTTVPLVLDECSTTVRSEENRREQEENTITVAAAPKEPSPVSQVWDYYRENIQPNARICPDSKIRTRLKRFSVDDLKAAVDHFKASYWWMTTCAKQGGKWFFESDDQIDKFLLLPPQTKEEYEAQHSKPKNGNTPTTALPAYGRTFQVVSMPGGR